MDRSIVHGSISTIRSSDDGSVTVTGREQYIEHNRTIQPHWPDTTQMHGTQGSIGGVTLSQFDTTIASSTALPGHQTARASAGSLGSTERELQWRTQEQMQEATMFDRTTSDISDWLRRQLPSSSHVPLASDSHWPVSSNGTNSNSASVPFAAAPATTTTQAQPTYAWSMNDQERSLSPPTSEFNVHAIPFPSSSDFSTATHQHHQLPPHNPQHQPRLDWDTFQSDGGSSSSQDDLVDGDLDPDGDVDDGFDEDEEDEFGVGEDYLLANGFGRGPFGAGSNSNRQNPFAGNIRSAGGYHASPGLNIRKLAESFLSGVDEEEDVLGVGSAAGKGVSSRPMQSQQHQHLSSAGSSSSFSASSLASTANPSIIRYDVSPMAQESRKLGFSSNTQQQQQQSFQQPSSSYTPQNDLGLNNNGSSANNSSNNIPLHLQHLVGLASAATGNMNQHSASQLNQQQQHNSHTQHNSHHQHHPRHHRQSSHGPRGVQGSPPPPSADRPSSGGGFHAREFVPSGSPNGANNGSAQQYLSSLSQALSHSTTASADGRASGSNGRHNQHQNQNSNASQQQLPHHQLQLLANFPGGLIHGATAGGAGGGSGGNSNSQHSREHAQQQQREHQQQQQQQQQRSSVDPRGSPIGNASSMFRTSPLLDPSGYEYDPDREERMIHLEETPFEERLLPEKIEQGKSILDLLDPETGTFIPIIPPVETESPTSSSSSGGIASEFSPLSPSPKALHSTLLVPIPVTPNPAAVSSTLATEKTAHSDKTEKPEREHRVETIAAVENDQVEKPNDSSKDGAAANPTSSVSTLDAPATSTPSDISVTAPPTQPQQLPRILFTASASTLSKEQREEDTLAFNQLHNALVSFTRDMHSLQIHALRLREELACRTRWAVRSVWPSAIVSVVGSVCAGVALPKSDLDFVVYFDAQASEQARQKYMAQMLERSSEDRFLRTDIQINEEGSVHLRLHPTAPPSSFPPFAHAGSLIKLIGGRKKSKLLFRSTKIQVFKDINLIRLRDGCSGVSVDLWFPLASDIHKRSQQHTSLIHGYMSAFKAFYPLSCTVKTFMQQAMLNSGYSGLGSYGILLMIVRFLQYHRYECLKDNKPEEGNLGRLLCSFFRFFISFDYENLGLDVREDGSFFDKAPLNELIREQQLRELGAMRAEAERRGTPAGAGPIIVTKSVTATMNAATMNAAVTGVVRPTPSPRRLDGVTPEPLSAGGVRRFGTNNSSGTGATPEPMSAGGLRSSNTLSTDSPSTPQPSSPMPMSSRPPAGAVSTGTTQGSQEKHTHLLPPSQNPHRRARAAKNAAAKADGNGSDEDSGGEERGGGAGQDRGPSGVDLDDPALLSHFTLVIQDPQDPANSIICHHKALRNMIHAFSKAISILDPFGVPPVLPQQAHWPQDASATASQAQPAGSPQENKSSQPAPSSSPAPFSSWSGARPSPVAVGGIHARSASHDFASSSTQQRPLSPGAALTDQQRSPIAHDPNVQITLPLRSQDAHASSTAPQVALSRFQQLIDLASAAQGPSQKPCPSSACRRAGPDGGPTMCPTQNKVCFTCGFMFVKPGVTPRPGSDRGSLLGSASGGGNGGGADGNYGPSGSPTQGMHGHHGHSHSHSHSHGHQRGSSYNGLSPDRDRDHDRERSGGRGFHQRQGSGQRGGGAYGNDRDRSNNTNPNIPPPAHLSTPGAAALAAAMAQQLRNQQQQGGGASNSNNGCGASGGFNTAQLLNFVTMQQRHLSQQQQQPSGNLQNSNSRPSNDMNGIVHQRRHSGSRSGKEEGFTQGNNMQLLQHQQQQQQQLQQSSGANPSTPLLGPSSLPTSPYITNPLNGQSAPLLSLPLSIQVPPSSSSLHGSQVDLGRGAGQQHAQSTPNPKHRMNRRGRGGNRESGGGGHGSYPSQVQQAQLSTPIGGGGNTPLGSPYATNNTNALLSRPSPGGVHQQSQPVNQYPMLPSHSPVPQQHRSYSAAPASYGGNVPQQQQQQPSALLYHSVTGTPGGGSIINPNQQQQSKTSILGSPYATNNTLLPQTNQGQPGGGQGYRQYSYPNIQQPQQQQQQPLISHSPPISYSTNGALLGSQQQPQNQSQHATFNAKQAQHLFQQHPLNFHQQHQPQLHQHQPGNFHNHSHNNNQHKSSQPRGSRTPF